MKSLIIESSTGRIVTSFTEFPVHYLEHDISRTWSTPRLSNPNQHLDLDPWYRIFFADHDPGRSNVFSAVFKGTVFVIVALLKSKMSDLQQYQLNLHPINVVEMKDIIVFLA